MHVRARSLAVAVDDEADLIGSKAQRVATPRSSERLISGSARLTSGLSYARPRVAQLAPLKLAALGEVRTGPAGLATTSH